MGVPLTSRKRKILSIATGAVLLVFVVLLSSNKLHSTSNIVIPSSDSLNSNKNNPLLDDNITVQIPGETNTKSSSDKNLNNKNNNINISNKDNDNSINTKKLTNANDFVKSKEGVIDESKVKQADSSNNIPLTAGNPNLKNNNDKSLSSKLDKTNDQKLDDELSSSSSSSSNGIKADKGLGSNEQKETLKKSLNDKIIEAQKKVQEEGVSKDDGSSFNPQQEYEKILSKSPVVIFSKSYCPFSKKLKKILKTEYNITPEPVIVELDNHENGKELQDHIGKETGRFTVPNFIVKGKSRGGSDDIVALHENDELVDLFHTWSSGAAKIERIGSKSDVKNALSDDNSKKFPKSPSNGALKGSKDSSKISKN